MPALLLMLLAFLLPAAPSSHRCFDLLVLLALHAKGGNSRKSVEACLKKKLLDGQTGAAWLSKSLKGHQVKLTGAWCTLGMTSLSKTLMEGYVSLLARAAGTPGVSSSIAQAKKYA